MNGCRWRIWLLAPFVSLPAALLLGQLAAAATVDISSSPLSAGLSKIVPPNIFLLMDDSANTLVDYMPDAVGDNVDSKCYRNWGHNKLAYNPETTYSPPPGSSVGSLLPNAVYTEAWINGFSHAAGTTDLSVPTTTTQAQPEVLGTNPFRVVKNSKTVTVTHLAHGYATGTVVTFTNLRSSNGSLVSTVGGVSIASTSQTNRPFSITVIDANHYSFVGSAKAGSTTTGGGSGPIATTYITVSIPTYYSQYTAAPTAPPSTCEPDASYTNQVPATTAEQTNFANWYSYYRTRSLMLKSTIGRAFAPLDGNYRVGFSSVNNSSATESAGKFRRIRAFTSTNSNRSNWYNSLYAVTPAGTNPLRAALSRTGRMYAGTLTGLTGSNDPVQYSCQQNFTLMVTDGYWTTGGETTTYGPYKMNGTTVVGDQDGDATKFRAPYVDANKVANTLADVASYYFNTDLRTSGQTGGPSGATGTGPTLDVSANNVPQVNSDKATWQHMNTFALALGANGDLAYNPTYLTGGSADYNAILAGTKSWPNPDPTNAAGQITSRIDDLWHAAVNGHGQYFSASNPDAIVGSLQGMLAAISRITSSAAAAATSSLEPVTGDNFAYVAQFTTGTWSGDLTARKIDLTTGVLEATPVWSAATQLSGSVGATSDTRVIYTYSTSTSNKLKPFTYGNLSSEISAGYFRSSSSNPNGALTQYNLLSGSAQSNLNTSANMIAWIRGQNGFEDIEANTANNRVYRARTSVLGDIVNSAPVYVKKPPFNYVDAGYASYITNQANRQAVVYVSSNDGMLHALNADTGAELWAYIPTQAKPYLYKLADSNYANLHRFLVDGSIAVGDVYDSATSSWKTILVGMLGAGGRGLYALDITDPTAPKALWEFSNASDGDLGYTLGNAIITKRNADGKWIVAFASGYNNSNTLSTNSARLFVVDALTGVKYAGTAGEIIATEETTDLNSTGIARITAYVASSRTNNPAQYVYGGSLSGSLFRFDLDDGVAQRLGRTSSVAGDLPITARPEVATITTSTGVSYRVVYIGTGRYLGATDLATTATSATKSQGIFAIKDTGADLGDLQAAGANLVEQTLDSSTSPSKIPNPQPVDWATKKGWYVKLPIGERINVDLKLQVGSLVGVSNTPIDDYCYTGGSSTQYVLAYKDGTAISSQATKNVGTPVGSSLATGVAVIKLPTGKVVSIITESDTTVAAAALPVDAAMGLSLRRVSWKELL